MKNTAQNAGFSLVEVALALLVAAIGLLSVMTIFPTGMDASKKAIDEAQSALFAEEIFAGFKAKLAITNATWASLDSMTVGPPAPDMWDNGNDISFRANGSGTNVYEYKYENSLLDYAVRYVMTVNDLPGYPGIKYLRLTVWNGEYGSTTNPLVYYTELFNPGK